MHPDHVPPPILDTSCLIVPRQPSFIFAQNHLGKKTYEKA